MFSNNIDNFKYTSVVALCLYYVGFVLNKCNFLKPCRFFTIAIAVLAKQTLFVGYTKPVTYYLCAKIKWILLFN